MIIIIIPHNDTFSDNGRKPPFLVILWSQGGRNLANVAKKQINYEHSHNKYTPQVWIGLCEYFLVGGFGRQPLYDEMGAAARNIHYYTVIGFWQWGGSGADSAYWNIACNCMPSHFHNNFGWIQIRIAWNPNVSWV